MLDPGEHTDGEILVSNDGDAPLEIGAIELSEGSHAKLGLADLPPEMPALVAPGSQLMVKVAFDPDAPFGAGLVTLGQVLIHSDDKDEPTVRVSVLARENAPEMVVTPPDEVDFAFVAPGYTGERVLTLYNAGPADLVVTALTIEGDDAGEIEMTNVGGSPGVSLPLTVASSAAEEVVFAFTNRSGPTGTVRALLKVESNDRRWPVYELDLVARRAATAECKAALVPERLHFGIVPYGQSRSLPMKIKNVGSGDCEILGLDDPDRLRVDDCGGGLPMPIPLPTGGCRRGQGSVSQTSKSFKVVGAPPPLRFGPGQYAELFVRFTPPEKASIFGEDFDNYRALLSMRLVDSNNGAEVWAPSDAADPTSTAATPNLAASAGISAIALIPQELDFGVVTVGCASETLEITLYNRGRAPLSLLDVKLDEGCSDELEVVSAPATPQHVVLGSPIHVSFRYVPQDTGRDECTVVFVSGDQDVPTLTATLRGEGSYVSTQRDTFTQAGAPKVDLLFVADSSITMDEELDNLARNVDDLLAAAGTWGAKYRVGMTTADIDFDRGRLRGVPRWVTESTPGGPEKLATSFRALHDYDAGSQEMGLEAAYLALTLPNTFLAETEGAAGEPVPIACTEREDCAQPAGCHADPEDLSRNPASYCGGPNWGFLRDDARLELVFVSDEPDQSPAELELYVDFFKSLKPPSDEDRIHAHAIVGTDGNAAALCSGPGGSAQPGTGYVSVVSELGGVLASICEADFGPALQRIGAIAFAPQRRFFLSRPARERSVRVNVRGGPCYGGWSFDPRGNSVIFDLEHSCMPRAGDTLEIRYETKCFP